MHDTIKIYRDGRQEWRWRRVTPNGNIVAESGEGYVRRIDCDRIALRINAQPYIVEVEGEVIVEIDVTQQIRHEEEPIGRATLGEEAPDDPVES